jgi:hypothetical protein
MTRPPLSYKWVVPQGHRDILDRPPSEIVDHVLRYLHGRERLAEIQDEPWLVIHYKLGWVQMYEAFYRASAARAGT